VSLSAIANVPSQLVAHIRWEEEGRKAHDIILGLRRRAAMATGEAGHCLEECEGDETMDALLVVEAQGRRRSTDRAAGTRAWRNLQGSLETGNSAGMPDRYGARAITLADDTFSINACGITYARKTPLVFLIHTVDELRVGDRPGRRSSRTSQAPS
jgi:hypothetical protein